MMTTALIVHNKCHTKLLFTQVENEAGKWVLVEKEPMRPFGWIDAQACIVEDKPEVSQEKRLSSDISQEVSVSYVKEPAGVETASTGEH